MPLYGVEQVDVMRIVCPNCNAQYEIDPALLPPEGREVQCSGCGTVWFQKPGETTPIAAASQPELSAAPDKAAQPAAEPTPEPDTPPEPDAPEPTEMAAPQSPPPVTSAPKPVDEKVLGILREEAAFETRQRERDRSVLESQPELGILGAAPWPSTATPGKMDASDSSTQHSDTLLKETPGTNAPAFPDIDDISATLEPIGRGRKFSATASDSASPTENNAESAQSNFLRGLIWPIVVAAVLMALYLAAPALSRTIPAITPALAGYVMLVDGLRDSLAGLFGR